MPTLKGFAVATVALLLLTSCTSESFESGPELSNEEQSKTGELQSDPSAGLPWRGYEKFPSLYFAAEPEGEFSEEQIEKISKFELAIIEFRMGQFMDEFDGGLWAEGDLQGLMNEQVKRIKELGREDIPILTYMNAKWAGSMYSDQRELLERQELFLEDSRGCEGFIDYPLDVAETGKTTGLEYCRWDFLNPDTQEAFAESVEVASSGPADGIFFDNSHSVSCDAEQEFSDMDQATREEFMLAQNESYLNVFNRLNELDKHPVLSTTMGFSEIGGQVPWEGDCPLWEEELLATMDGVSFSRNNEFWMWNLGETASNQILNSIKEADQGVPLIVHTPYFPSGSGCLEGCFGENKVDFSEQEFLEFSVAAFLIAMSPGSFFGFSNMEAESEGGGWFDQSWDYHSLYDEIVTGRPIAETEISEDRMQFSRDFENGSVFIDVMTGEYELNFEPPVKLPHGSLSREHKSMNPATTTSDWHLHDPSSIVELNGWQVVAVTGKENADGYRCGLETWKRQSENDPWQPDQCLYIEKPDWISDELPLNDGAFWAPDLGDDGTLFYSVANGFEESGSCVGAARWNGQTWQDVGQPLTCAFEPDETREIEAIDPSIVALDDKLFLVVGGGLIVATELNPKTLLVKSGDWWEPGHPDWIELATGPQIDDEQGWVEAAQVVEIGQWHYLFVNWGECCRGLDSTYEVRIGRAKSIDGPFLDKQGTPMNEGGGSLFFETTGDLVGPGHMSVRQGGNGSLLGSFHFYHGKRDGLPWIGEAELSIKDGWPEIKRLLPITRPE